MAGAVVDVHRGRPKDRAYGRSLMACRQARFYLHRRLTVEMRPIQHNASDDQMVPRPPAASSLLDHILRVPRERCR